MHNATSSYDAMVKQLTVGTASGQMNKYLHTYAALWNTLDLSNATFGTPSTTNLNLNSNERSPKTLPTIVGILIIVIVVLTVAVVLVYFFRRVEELKQKKVYVEKARRKSQESDGIPVPFSVPELAMGVDQEWG